MSVLRSCSRWISSAGAARATLTLGSLAMLLAGCGQAMPIATPPVAAAPSTPPASAPIAASEADGREPIFCYVEVLTADRPSVYGYMAARGCVPSGSFKQGERIVWRFVVMDTRTGQRVTDKDAARVSLRLASGEEIPADYKQRGEGSVADAPWTWDVCWDVPLDYPIGVLDYSIHVATKDGRGGSWTPPSLVDPGRGIDTRPQVIPKDLPTNPERTS
jgi:hypothetical protein